MKSIQGGCKPMFGRRKQRANFNNQLYFNPYPTMNPYIMMPAQNDFRQYPYPNHYNEQANWNPYMQPNSSNMNPHFSNYPYQSMQPPMYNQYPQPNYSMQQYNQQTHQNSYNQSVFHNPLEPEPSQYPTNVQQPFSPNQYMNPYPKQSFIPKQPSGVQSIMNSFKSQDGSLDINKMMDTAGSMVNAVTQVSSMVKGLGGMIKI